VISKWQRTGSSLRSARRVLASSMPMMRSLSRTELTSGLVTTIASSA
jgi:hypothetical protein